MHQLNVEANSFASNPNTKVLQRTWTNSETVQLNIWSPISGVVLRDEDSSHDLPLREASIKSLCPSPDVFSHETKET